jgi:hypothetical protein
MGFGDFSSRNEGDMLLRNVNTGGLMLYDIANNQITGAFFLGNVGLDWQFAGVGPIKGPGTSDLVLRNVNTGAFQVYNLANNQLTGSAPLGTVGLDWQLGRRQFRRLRRAHSPTSRTINSCKRWRALVVAAVQPTA